VDSELPTPNILSMKPFLSRSLLVLLTGLSTTVAAPLVQTGNSIAFLGDSITQFGAQSPGGYVQLVRSGLAANGIDVSIIPAGISGQKSNQMLERLDASVLSKKPTWMTLSCGVNDVWHSKNGRGVELEDYKKNITEIVDRAEKAGTKVMLLTATLIGPDLEDPLNKKAVAYNDFLRELAQQRKLPLADLSADMIRAQSVTRPNGAKQQLTGDGVHMNHLGNVMMAEGVLRAFGLDDAQLTVAQNKWNTLPDAVTVTAKLKLSLPEMTKLEAQADSEKKSLDDLLTERLRAALDPILKSGGASQ